MRRLLHPDGAAPPVDGDDHSFRFVHSETGHVSFAQDWWTWKEKIYAHRVANGLTIPDNMMAIAEDQLCGTLPPDWCVFEVGDRPPVNIKFSLEDVRSWVRAVTTRFVSGAPFVEQDEAERRARICVSCPLNTQVQGGCGGGCQKLTEMLTPGMRGRKTQWDEKLKSCGVCHCYNRIGVHFPLDVLAEYDTAERQEAYPDFCWKKLSA